MAMNTYLKNMSHDITSHFQDVGEMKTNIKTTVASDLIFDEGTTE